MWEAEQDESLRASRLDHWTPEKWSRVTEHSADINNEAPLCSLWFLLSDQHIRRLRSDPAGHRQTGLQPGPAAGSVSWPGKDEAVAADGGGRPLDDGVHALLLRPAEVETGSSPDPDSWKPGFLIGEQIGDSGAAAGVRLFSWNNKRTTSSRYSPTEPPSPSHLLREQSDVGRAAEREFSLFSKWGAFKVLKCFVIKPKNVAVLLKAVSCFQADYNLKVKQNKNKLVLLLNTYEEFSLMFNKF